MSNAIFLQVSANLCEFIMGMGEMRRARALLHGFGLTDRQVHLCDPYRSQRFPSATCSPFIVALTRPY